MRSHPKISVVMPVYNSEKYLEESIKSILDQDFKEFEFLIIYDESNDESLSIIQAFAELDERIKIIHGDGLGIASALNTGVKYAVGTYIARHDSDDISLPNRLNIQYHFLEKTNLDICGGCYFIINERGKILKSQQVALNDVEILLTMATNVPFPHPSVLMRKSFLIDNNLQYRVDGSHVCEDLDLWIRLFDAGAKFGNVAETILKYRIVSNSLSRRYASKIKLEAISLFNKYSSSNQAEIEAALNLIIDYQIRSDLLERVAVKALCRISQWRKIKNLFIKYLLTFRIKNIIIGLASYHKAKYFN